MADAAERSIGFFSMISLDSVTFSFSRKARPAVDSLTLRVGAGETVSVMGANGSGKTTLIHLIAGVKSPATGTITIDSKSPVEFVREGNVGFLFQDPDNGLVASTVDREVAFALENRNVAPPEIEMAVKDALRTFAIDHLFTKRVAVLSGGEKQQVCLAGVFVTSPRLLILDEPASYLDRDGAMQLEDAIARFRREATDLTVIRVTQYASVAATCSRIVLLHEGRLLADGTPEEVFSDREKLLAAAITPPVKYRSVRKRYTEQSHRERRPAPERSCVLSCQNVSYSYEDVTGDKHSILRDLSIALRAGEVAGLVGKIGSGKSTLAQVMCGLIQPDSGIVRIDKEGGKAAMAFQQPEKQFFCDSISAEIMAGIDGNQLTAMDPSARIEQVLHSVGLDPAAFAEKDPHSISGGEARRLALAVVAALDTDLIILDEPTCGLDAHGVAAVQTFVRQLSGRGKAILLISHNSDILADVADRIVVLKEGAIAVDVPVLRFFADRLHEQYLATPDTVQWQLDRDLPVTEVRSDQFFST